jgi:hypothetical protein
MHVFIVMINVTIRPLPNYALEQHQVGVNAKINAKTRSLVFNIVSVPVKPNSIKFDSLLSHVFLFLFSFRKSDIFFLSLSRSTSTLLHVQFVLGKGFKSFNKIYLAS